MTNGSHARRRPHQGNQRRASSIIHRQGELHKRAGSNRHFSGMPHTKTIHPAMAVAAAHHQRLHQNAAAATIQSMPTATQQMATIISLIGSLVPRAIHDHISPVSGNAELLNSQPSSPSTAVGITRHGKGEASWISGRDGICSISNATSGNEGHVRRSPCLHEHLPAILPAAPRSSQRVDRSAGAASWARRLTRSCLRH